MILSVRWGEVVGGVVYAWVNGSLFSYPGSVFFLSEAFSSLFLGGDQTETVTHPLFGSLFLSLAFSHPTRKANIHDTNVNGIEDRGECHNQENRTSHRTGTQSLSFQCH
jgi:hypothetical protein